MCKNVVEKGGGEADVGEMEGEVAGEVSGDGGGDFLEFTSDRVSDVGCGGGGDGGGERREESEEGERRKRRMDGRMGNGRVGWEEAPEEVAEKRRRRPRHGWSSRLGLGFGVFLGF